MNLLPKGLGLVVWLASASPTPPAAASLPPAAPQGAAGSCPALPSLQAVAVLKPGELLDYELDAVGAHAGTMSVKTLGKKDGQLPIEVSVETSTFFSKVRKVKGTGTSYLDAKTFRPRQYVEDSIESGIHRTADVQFHDAEQVARLSYTTSERPGKRQLKYAREAFDALGAIMAFRQLPMKEGLTLCTDVYGVRRLWHLEGKIVGRESITVPVGNFKAWHFSGTARRLDDAKQQREVHIWISDDARRLPLAAVGAMDLGAVRATLSGFRRPGEKSVKAEGAESLKW